MKNIILTLLIVFSLSSNAYCFDAIGYFQSKSVWGGTIPSGAESVLIMFKGRFNGFTDQLKATSLFGFTTQLASASSGGVSSSVFVVPAGAFGTFNVDFADWPSDILITLKSVLLIMSFFMFTKILFKGGVS